MDALKALDDEDEKDDDHKSILGRCRSAVAHFNYSTVAIEQLHAEQLRLNLKKSNPKSHCKTRFGSALAMMEWLVTNRAALVSVYPRCRLTPDDWEVLPHVVSCLRPWQTFADHIGGEGYPSLSDVLIGVSSLLSTPRPEPIDGVPVPALADAFYDALFTAGKERMDAFSVPIICAAMLDPRQSKLAYLKPPERKIVFDALRAELNKLPPLPPAAAAAAAAPAAPAPVLLAAPPPPAAAPAPPAAAAAAAATPRKKKQSYADLTALLRRPAAPAAASEFDVYVSGPPVDDRKDPMQLWRERAGNYPNLSRLALRYLCIPASSIPCERVFSVAGNTITKRRCSLAPARAEKLVYLHENLDILNYLPLKHLLYSPKQP